MRNVKFCHLNPARNGGAGAEIPSLAARVYEQKVTSECFSEARHTWKRAGSESQPGSKAAQLPEGGSWIQMVERYRNNARETRWPGPHGTERLQKK